MTIKKIIHLIASCTFGVMLLFGTTAFAEQSSGVYDEAAYTEYVETTMKKLDGLYLDFCSTCNIDASKALKARNEFYKLSRELMQHMNDRFDKKKVKQGDALSPTETLVSIHVLTMLVDIMTETQMQQLSDHPYNN